MKPFFTSILFCLLLLPGVGRGQGIIVSKFANDAQLESSDNDHIFLDYFLPSPKFKYLDTAGIIKKQKVKAIYVYNRYEKSNPLFSAIFDTAGRMTHQAWISKNKDRNIIIDSFFHPHKTIVSKRYFKNPDTLFGRDTIIILHNNAKTKITAISYRLGSYLNERNDEFNKIDRHAAYSYVTYRTNKTMNSYYMYSGVQIAGNMDAYINKMSEPPSEKFCPFTPLKTNYKNNILYKSHREIFLLHKTGKPETIRKTYWTDKEGMDLLNHNRTSYRSKKEKAEDRKEDRNFEIFRYMKQQVSRNPKGLPDTICNYTYPKENSNRCVKPKDPDCNFYLQGRSGVPIHTNIYTIRYEYFND